jgi:hypothetical protein
MERKGKGRGGPVFLKIDTDYDGHGRREEGTKADRCAHDVGIISQLRIDLSYFKSEAREVSRMKRSQRHGVRS